jgi:hypothetical protein
MLELNPNEEKKMVFEVQIHGVESDQLSGSVKFNIKGVDFGFPVYIDQDIMEAVVPPLSKIVKWDFEEGSVVEARLDLNTDEYYFTPWKGQVKMKAPRKISARLENEDFMSKKPTIKTTLKSRAIDEPAQSTEVKSNVALNQTLKKLVQQELDRSRVPVRKENKPRKTNLNEIREMATKENIIKFMAKRGVRNQRIQEIVYEQSVQAAGGEGDMLKVLKKVMEAIKKR